MTRTQITRRPLNIWASLRASRALADASVCRGSRERIGLLLRTHSKTCHSGTSIGELGRGGGEEKARGGEEGVKSLGSGEADRLRFRTGSGGTSSGERGFEESVLAEEEEEEEEASAEGATNSGGGEFGGLAASM